jgi:hypothetical protein
MQLEPAEYEENTNVKERDERVRLIGLILDEYVSNQPPEQCGERFNLLYEKTLPELRIYYQVFK